MPSLAAICVPMGLNESERSIAWLLWHGWLNCMARIGASCLHGWYTQDEFCVRLLGA